MTRQGGISVTLRFLAPGETDGQRELDPGVYLTLSAGGVLLGSHRIDVESTRPIIAAVDRALDDVGPGSPGGLADLLEVEIEHLREHAAQAAQDALLRARQLSLLVSELTAATGRERIEN